MVFLEMVMTLLNSSLLCSFATNQKASPENKKVSFQESLLQKKMGLYIHEFLKSSTSFAYGSSMNFTNSLHVMRLFIGTCGIVVNCDSVPFLEWYWNMFLAILGKGECELGLAHNVANF